MQHSRAGFAFVSAQQTRFLDKARENRNAIAIHRGHIRQLPFLQLPVLGLELIPRFGEGLRAQNVLPFARQKGARSLEIARLQAPVKRVSRRARGQLISLALPKRKQNRAGKHGADERERHEQLEIMMAHLKSLTRFARTERVG